MAVYTAIDDPEAYFQTVIYTGNGSANHAITLPADTDMQPDFVWIKNRDTTDSHCLFDSVRGATKIIYADTETVEATDADTLDSFTSDGFQVDADVKVNTNTEDYVAWNWKESATSGFDIVAYTGNGDARTISHNLSAVPKFIMIKDLDATNHWIVYHNKNTSAPETDFLILCENNATQDDTKWNDTLPTSSVFSLGADQGDVNTDGNDFIAYVFAEKQGFSKFGTYTGNANNDGPFIYTGFRPAYVMMKMVNDATQNWSIYDNTRNPTNPMGKALWAEVTDAEYDYSTYLDFVSNGIKIRTSSAGPNKSGQVFIYMAFSSAPFVNSNGVPCNAR